MEPNESDISERVAALLSKTWSTYWRASAAGEVLSGRLAAQAARQHLDLYGEVAFARNGGRWRDLRLPVAASLIAAFGDGYAISSTSWPNGIPEGSLPDPFTASRIAIAAGVDDWAATLGHPLAFDVPKDGATTRADRGGEEQYERFLAYGVAVDTDELRLAERPEWDGYERASEDTALRLHSWIDGYHTYRRRADSEGDSFLLAACAATRELASSELAYLRRTFNRQHYFGAQAEAVLGTLVTISVVRCVFLLTTAEAVQDVSGLNLMSAEHLSDALATLGLDRWLSDSNLA